ncbi:MAG: hypothetical protein ABFE16_16665, partial [Armatimonadia bacterium]
MRQLRLVGCTIAIAVSLFLSVRAPFCSAVRPAVAAPLPTVASTAAEFLADPLVPRLADGLPRLTSEGATAKQYELPPEAERMAGGALIGAAPGRLVLCPSPLYVSEFSIGSEVLVPCLGAPKTDALAEAARQFANRRYAEVLRRLGVVEMSPPLWQGLLDGNFRAAWVMPAVRPELSLTLDLRPWDGKVVGLHAIYTPGFWREEETVDLPDLASRVRSELRLRAGDASMVTAAAWYRIKPEGKEQTFFVIDVARGPRPALPKRGSAILVAATGAPFGMGGVPAHLPRRYSNLDFDHPGPRDSWPCWMTKGLAYIASRGPASGADVFIPPQVMIAAEDGTMRFLTLNLTRGARCLDVQGHKAVVGFENGTVCLVDLQQGRCDMGDFRGEAMDGLALAPEGNCLTLPADRRRGDGDLFMVRVLDTGLSSLAAARRKRLDGLDELPCWSPTGDRVAFAHSTYEEGEGRNCQLWAFSLRKPDLEGAKPELVVGNLESVGRLSFFPDGRRLLVSHGDKLDVVDVEAKTRTPLNLPALHDPDLPAGCPALRLRDPAVSPDGTRLAFSGYRDSGDPEHGT